MPAHDVGVEDHEGPWKEDMAYASEMELMLNGYGLTTARIFYRYPDHPHLLQTYIWQDYDLAPKFPALLRFIEFWKEKLDGPLHSVAYTHRRLIAPNEWRNVGGEFLLQ